MAADPCGANINDLQSEDMSSYFQNLLQNSSSGVQIQASKAPAGSFFKSDCQVRDAAAMESSSSFILSDPSPGGFYDKRSIMNPVACVGGGNSEDIISPSVKPKSFWAINDVSEVGGGNRKGDQAFEASVNPIPSRSSSKRGRTPEVHNLSEKRRRNRINEKMKALQNLIPNSNKTDKASMLDEAIEYLKQLQLQVQMLTMRNGLSFPIYLPRSLQAMEPPQTGMHFDETNVFPDINRDAETYSRDHGISAQIIFDSSSNTAADPTLAVPMLPDITNPGTSFCLESSIKPQIANKMTNHPN